MPRDSFENFYYRHVALGEGCGCAESVTRMLELDAYAKARSEPLVVFETHGTAWNALARLLRRIVSNVGARTWSPPTVPALLLTPDP